MGLRLSRSCSRSRITLLMLVGMVFFLAFGSDWIAPPKAFRTAHPASNQQASLKSGKAMSKIGKVSMLYGTPGEIYDRAIKSHDIHNEKFGYKFFILREKTLPAYWSKPAYILSKILAELSKPADERLEWLVWVDADIVIMNPNIPLEIFLPPPGWEHIHCVATNDHRGLNNGVVFLRVHEWSVWLMNAVLGTEIFQPNLELEFQDQTAMMHWLDQERFAEHTIHVPQRWFNAYAGYRGDPKAKFSDPLQPQWKSVPRDIKDGDLLVHHAGSKTLREQRMIPWLDAADRHLPQWEVPLEQTTYPKELEVFWAKHAPQEANTQEKLRQALIKAKEKKKALAQAKKLEKEKQKAESKAQAQAQEQDEAQDQAQDQDSAQDQTQDQAQAQAQDQDQVQAQAQVETDSDIKAGEDHEEEAS